MAEEHLQISQRVSLPLSELELRAVRSQGAGGQNVNKVASAIHLFFDLQASSLPEFYKQRLMALGDQRISSRGVIVIKAQRHRTQEQNRDDALRRLTALLQSVAVTQKARRPTRPTRSSQRKRVDTKKKRGAAKQLRGRVRDTD